MNIKNNLKTITILIFIILNFSCREKETTITIPLKTEITTIDPHLSYDYVSNFVTHQIYDTLYSFHYLKRPYQIEPLIADGMPEFTNKGKELIIKIKKNIYYHPIKGINQNIEVKAQDFVHSFKRLAYKHTASRAWWLAKNVFIGLDEIHNSTDSLDELINAKLPGIVALDDYTLKLSLKKSLPPHQILNLLTMSFTAPIPKEVFTILKNDLSLQEVGTGAYILESLDLKKEVILKASRTYNVTKYPSVGDRFSHDQNLLADANKTIPFISKVNFQVESNEKSRWEKFKSKDFSIVELPRPYTEEVLKENGSLHEDLVKKNIQMEQSSSLAFWFIEFNMTQATIGNNLLLRKAIAHAIDMRKFLWDFSHNADQKANSLFTPGIFGYHPSKDLPYSFDLEKAKKLLKDAGYNNGKGLPTITFDTRRETEFHVKQAEFIKESLAQLGINLEIRVNTFTQFIERVKNNSMTMWQGGWLLDFPDAENILQLFYSKNAGNGGPNKSNFNNKEFDTLFEKMIKLDNNKQKLDLLIKLEDIVLNEMPIIMLYYSKNYFLYHEEIKNFRFNELSMGIIKYLKVQK